MFFGRSIINAAVAYAYMFIYQAYKNNSVLTQFHVLVVGQEQHDVRSPPAGFRIIVVRTLLLLLLTLALAELLRPSPGHHRVVVAVCVVRVLL